FGSVMPSTTAFCVGMRSRPWPSVASALGVAVRPAPVGAAVVKPAKLTSVAGPGCKAGFKLSDKAEVIPWAPGPATVTATLATGFSTIVPRPKLERYTVPEASTATPLGLNPLMGYRTLDAGPHWVKSRPAENSTYTVLAPKSPM